MSVFDSELSTTMIFTSRVTGRLTADAYSESDNISSLVIVNVISFLLVVSMDLLVFDCQVDEARSVDRRCCCVEIF